MENILSNDMLTQDVKSSFPGDYPSLEGKNSVKKEEKPEQEVDEESLKIRQEIEEELAEAIRQENLKKLQQRSRREMEEEEREKMQ